MSDTTSSTSNEFTEPGSNYPDTEKAGEQPREENPATPEAGEPSHVAAGIGVIDGSQPGDEHYGQDAGRDTLTVAESQKAMSDEQEQRLPAMDQNNADQVDKVAGIVAQTRQDIGTGTHDEIRHIIAQRLEQSGIHLPDDEIDELVKQVSTGD